MLDTILILILVIVVIPWGRWGVTFLENRFKRLDKVPEDAVGLILLGGSFDRKTTLARNVLSYNLAGGRFFAFIELAQDYPDKRLVFTGAGRPMDDKVNESALAADVLDKIRLDKSRFIFESKSRDTIENATLTFDLIQPKSEEKWVLVTSASHMPRAVGVFRKAGWHIIPFPVDYHTTGKYSLWPLIDFQYGFMHWRVTIHEFGRLVLNYISGKSDQLTPS